MGYVVFGSSTTVYSLYPLGHLLCSHGRLSKISSCAVTSHRLPTRVFGCPLRLSQITWVWRFQQRQPPAGSRSPNGDRHFEFGLGYPVSVRAERQACSIGSLTIVPSQDKISSIGGACDQARFRLRASGLIRHRRSLRSSHLSSQVLHDSHRVTLEKLIF